MKYNPYNWKINSKKERCEMCDEFYKEEVVPIKTNCILNELGSICAEIELKRIECLEKEKEIQDLNKELISLEQKKLSIIQILSSE